MAQLNLSHAQYVVLYLYPTGFNFKARPRLFIVRKDTAPWENCFGYMVAVIIKHASLLLVALALVQTRSWWIDFVRVSSNHLEIQ